MEILGSGDYRYQRVESWPDLPRNWKFGLASDGAVNSKDEIYIFSRGIHPITIWDFEGNFISSWGEGEFGSPHGIFIDPSDNVWLVDSNYHLVTQHDPNGQILDTWGRKLQPSASYLGMPFNMPSGLAFAPNGEIFVSDGYGGHRVHKFSPEGELLHSWGKQGAGAGEFALLHNIWVDKNSRVYICDRENDRIQIFSDNGEFIEEWTDLQKPGDIWIHNDDVYVVEQGSLGTCGVSIWSLEGDLITRWRGIEAGHGICVDSRGNIYVTEIGEADKVSKFERI